MVLHAWFVPTLDRLVSMMRYPDKENEFGSSKVSPDAVRQALSLLLRHMHQSTPEPRIEPTPDGGLRLEWMEYWVDCVLTISPDGGSSVKLSVLEANPISLVEAIDIDADILLERALRMIDEVIRTGSSGPLQRQAGRAS